MHRTLLGLVCAFVWTACGSESGSGPPKSQPTDTNQDDEHGKGDQAAPPADEAARRIVAREIGAIAPLHAHGSIYFAGQPTEEDMAALQKAGIKTIVNLRTASELTFDEAALAKQLGMDYLHEPVAGAKGLSDEVLGRMRTIFDNTELQPLFVHCASANRVGAAWLAHRLTQGATEEQAMAESRRIGLSSEALATRAKAYAKQK